jgi:hypothetical protein
MFLITTLYSDIYFCLLESMPISLVTLICDHLFSNLYLLYPIPLYYSRSKDSAQLAYIGIYCYRC